MSEEEILDTIQDMLKQNEKQFEAIGVYLHLGKTEQILILGLLDLYKQTKKSEEILANKLQKVNIKLNQEKERSFHFEKSNEMFADSYSKMAKAFNIKSYAINANIIINHINENFISKDKIKEMQKYREFELQQEYKDFEEDVEWRTYKKILEEK